MGFRHSNVSVFFGLVCCLLLPNVTIGDQCNEFVDMEFDRDLQARDARGTLIPMTIIGNVENIDRAAEFPNGPGLIYLHGTADTYLSNDFVAHFQLILQADAASSMNENQCIVGNRLVNSETETNTFSVTIERDERTSLMTINVKLTYLVGSQFINSMDSTQTTNLELQVQFDVDERYDFWLIYRGSVEEVYAAVLEGTEILAMQRADIPGSRELIGSQTGFLFGQCQDAGDYVGTLDKVEMYRDCYPENDGDDVGDAYRRMMAYWPRE